MIGLDGNNDIAGVAIRVEATDVEARIDSSSFLLFGGSSAGRQVPSCTTPCVTLV